MITVRDLLREIHVNPLTGESGLDAPIRWVHITELEDPTPWLTGGELLLTTGIRLNSRRKQEKFVERVANYGLAGLGIGTGFEFQEVPEAMIATAATIDFPLFEVPYNKPFIEITERVSSLLVDDQYALLDRSLSAQERLMNILFARRGSEVLVDALTALVGGMVIVFDRDGQSIFARRFRRPLDNELQKRLGEEIRQRVEVGLPAQPFVPASDEFATRTLVLPISSPELDLHFEDKPSLQGAWLAVIKDGGGLSEFDRMVLRQAALVFALDFFAVQVEKANEQDYGVDTLRQLLSGSLRGSQMVKRLNVLGLSGELSGFIVKAAEGRLSVGQAKKVVAQLRSVFHSAGSTALILSVEDVVYVLAAELPFRWLEEVGEKTIQTVAQAVDISLSLAEGLTVSPDRAHEALITAKFAIDANLDRLTSKKQSDHEAPYGNVVSYRSLGILAVLIESAQSGHLQNFCDATLAAIDAADRRYRGELIRSLDAFLAVGGHWEKATEALGCHRHTLRYRIKKVESVTGRDLTLMHNSVELWLALRGRELLQGL